MLLFFGVNVMPSKKKQAMIIAILAGILLLISGFSGLATWEAIRNFVTTNIVNNFVVQIIFAILIFIASLGGLSVIIGGLLIGRSKIKFQALLHFVYRYRLLPDFHSHASSIVYL